MMRTSGKLRLAALTVTTTSPGPALGEGNSSNVSDSGGPYCLQTTAFINIECHMPALTTDDGVRLHYEEAGAGTPVVFVHEFGGDHRSWEPQIQYFSRRYRCIAFNARGYPPSDVPQRVSSYSTGNAVRDMAAVLHHLRVGRAHIMGCSMGAQSTLHFGLTHPKMALTLTTIGAGSGSSGSPAEMKRTAEKNARRYEEEGL